MSWQGLFVFIVTSLLVTLGFVIREVTKAFDDIDFEWDDDL